MLERVNGGDNNFVAAAVGECQAVALEFRSGFENDIRRRVVALVQRVGPVLLKRRGESNVADNKICDVHREKVLPG
jgi:hypothetical protein